ncbi:MAG: undecaprenyldiphospho-muramoylpentapeptide beta-N-acetylglucosaminyltransferase [Verrucomicrobium sp.]|nr:undecaprenyldiphospho-muramoylpentapeptide beta-N-acetylglucosaminyltransferase [Verrucomicrobium sp.]
MRVAIACGGTGGHLFPGLAVAEALRRRGHEALLLVSEKEIDRTALEGRGEFASRALPAVGWPGLGPRLPGFFLKLWRSASACRRLFQDYAPDAVLSMGGFTGAAPLWIAGRRKIPAFLHESNAVPGRVTRLFARRVDRVLVGFGACAAALSPARCSVTGTPVRGALREVPRAEAASALGLDPSRRTLLVAGGSQGARALNRLVCRTLPLWKDRLAAWQFIHLSGAADAEETARAYQDIEALAHVRPFSAQMAEIYSLADLAVGRSGASTLTELAHYGLPSLLVPLPTAAEDHQTANARIFTQAGAASLFRQEDLTPQAFDAAVRGVLGEEHRLQEMARAARALAVPDAAGRVAEAVLNGIQKGELR